MRPYTSRSQMERGRRRIHESRSIYGGGSSSMTHLEAMERARQRAAITRPLESIPVPLVPASTEAVSGLGKLAILPNEVVMVVLEQCSLSTLYKMRLVNKAFDMMVRLLSDYSYVANTVKGIKQRALDTYRRVMQNLEIILTFNGMRRLLMSNTCEKCGKAGGSFKLTRVKVLCDQCGPQNGAQSR